MRQFRNVHIIIILMFLFLFTSISYANTGMYIPVYNDTQGQSNTEIDNMQGLNGNIGIGSANPGQLLDIQGTVRAVYFIGNGSLTGSVGLGTTTINGSGLTINGITTHNGNVGMGTTIINGTGLTINSTIATTGNVGIGTTVSPQKLYVVGNGFFTTGINIGIGTATKARLCIQNNTVSVGGC